MTTDLNLEAIADELHRSRHSDAEMADLARRYMRKLIDAVLELQAMVEESLPEPDCYGNYRLPCGSYIFKSNLNGKWVAANRKIGGAILDDDNVKYFNTPLEAARALAAMGEGPGATI